MFLEISKPLPVSVQMSIRIKIVWAFIDKDPETGNHLLSALHIFVVIFYHELENKNFWIHTYSHSVTIAIHPSIVGTDPIWFFFYEWHLGWVIYYFELDKYGKIANHSVKI